MSAFTLKGQAEMIERLKRLKVDGLAQVKRAMMVEGERIMARSKRDFVPVGIDHGGTLRASGRAELVEGDDRSLSVKLSYGGAAAAYALVVHEHPSDMDPPTWEGKEIRFNPSDGTHGPKYLERPLMEAADGFAEKVARVLRRL